jgi:hypothetical protein
MRGTFLHWAVVLAAGAGALLVLPAPALALEQKLVAPDGAAGDRLGDAVAVAGDTAVVGALFDDGGRGAVYVFTRTADSWTQTAKLTATDGDMMSAPAGQGAANVRGESTMRRRVGRG